MNVLFIPTGYVFPTEVFFKEVFSSRVTIDIVRQFTPSVDAEGSITVVSKTEGRVVLTATLASETYDVTPMTFQRTGKDESGEDVVQDFRMMSVSRRSDGTPTGLRHLGRVTPEPSPTYEESQPFMTIEQTATLGESDYITMISGSNGMKLQVGMTKQQRTDHIRALNTAVAAISKSIGAFREASNGLVVDPGRGMIHDPARDRAISNISIEEVTAAGMPVATSADLDRLRERMDKARQTLIDVMGDFHTVTFSMSLFDAMNSSTVADWYRQSVEITRERVNMDNAVARIVRELISNMVVAV